jgi:hypothetical protein
MNTPARALGVLLALALAGCAAPPPQKVGHGPSVATPGSPGAAEAQVAAEFQRFCVAMSSLDHAGIAAMFDASGELSNSGYMPVRGPRSIDAYFATFQQYKMIEYHTEPPHITINNGKFAQLVTTFREQLQSPSGHVLSGSGHLQIDWGLDKKGHWVITQLSTSPM